MSLLLRSASWFSDVSDKCAFVHETFSSVYHRGMVYEDAEKLYAEVRKNGEPLLEAAFKTLFPDSTSFANATSSRSPGTIIAYNTTFFPRRDVVPVPLSGKSSNLKSQVVQTSIDGSVGYALMDCTEGEHIARTSGLFADSMPVSGE